MKSKVTGIDGSGAAGICSPLFDIRQRQDDDGWLRVTLIGELDLAVTARLHARLEHLSRSAQPVRLDLSQLQFIDCGGVGAIARALSDARQNGWELEVDRVVSPIVARIAELDEIASALWPGVVGSAVTG
jgi:anti-sigma B factor antagonist